MPTSRRGYYLQVGPVSESGAKGDGFRSLLNFALARANLESCQSSNPRSFKGYLEKRHGLGYAVGTSQKYRFQPKGCGGQLGGKLHSFTWASGHIGASMFHIDPAFQSCLGSVVGVVRMQVGVT